MQSWLCHKTTQKHLRESNANISVLATIYKRKDLQMPRTEKITGKLQQSTFTISINTQVLQFLIEAGLLHFLRRSNLLSLKN